MTRERFKVDSVIYDTNRIQGFSQTDVTLPVSYAMEGAPGLWLDLKRTSPALGQLAHGPWNYRISNVEILKRSQAVGAEYVEQARTVARILASIQRVEPEVPMLREYSKVAQVRNMGGSRGEFCSPRAGDLSGRQGEGRLPVVAPAAPTGGDR